MDEARFERSAYTKAQLENYPRYKRLQKQYLQWNGWNALSQIANVLWLLAGGFSRHNGDILFKVVTAAAVSNAILFCIIHKEDKIEQQIHELEQKARN